MSFNFFCHTIFLFIIFFLANPLSSNYNKFKYGDWSPTRILVAPHRITNDRSDLEQQDSELQGSLHI